MSAPLDNYTLYERHEAEVEKWLKTRPVCPKCGEPIQDDCGYMIEEELLCERCAEEWWDEHRVWID